MTMPAKQGLRNKNIFVGEDGLFLAAGAYDLVALSPSGKHCARRIILVSGGNFTHVYNSKGVDRGPWNGLPANYLHDMDTSFVDSTSTMVVYF